MTLSQPKRLINRARSVVEAAFTKVAGKLLFLSHLRPFSYWDNYYGEHPEITSDFFQLLDYETIQRFDNKGNVAKIVTELGIEGLFPATYFSVEEALASGAQPRLWFSKPTYSTSGKGIVCVKHDQLADHELPRNHIIQAQVSDIELLNERKYTARAYVLVHHHRMYLFDDGFVMIHGPRYDENATDFAVQVDHAGYTEADSPIHMLRMVELPDYERKFDQLIKTMRTLKPVLREFIEASSPTHYGLLGIDLLFTRDHQPVLIEINSKANFVHTQAINDSVNSAFFAAVLSTLYTGHTDRQLTEI